MESSLWLVKLRQAADVGSRNLLILIRISVGRAIKAIGWLAVVVKVLEMACIAYIELKLRVLVISFVKEAIFSSFKSDLEFVSLAKDVIESILLLWAFSCTPLSHTKQPGLNEDFLKQEVFSCGVLGPEVDFDIY